MNRIFSIGSPSPIPDGTLLSPLLNPKDSESGLPFDLLDGFSLAAGVIDPGARSRVHLIPFSTQVTFVLAGSLAVKMKGPDDARPYTLSLKAGQAVLTEPGVFLQLINEGTERCETLYIVSPAYVFEAHPGGEPSYDDSVVLDEDWDDLAKAGWRASRPMPTPTERADAMQRLSKTKRRS